MKKALPIVFCIATAVFSLVHNARSQRIPSDISLDFAIIELEDTVQQTVEGIPTDWSHRHLVFSQPVPGSGAESSAQQEPRFWMQHIRYSLSEDGGGDASNPARGRSALNASSSIAMQGQSKKRKNTLTRDWSVNMGNNATVGNEMFPAKFAFTTGSANCGNVGSPDYVVFNTSLGGASAVAASRTGSFGGQPTNNQTLQITNGPNSVTLRARNTSQVATDFQIGTTTSETATNLAAAIASNGAPVAVTATSSGSSVTVTSTIPGASGNSITFTNGLANFSITSPLTGGADGQATILAFDNLYSSCTGTVPTTYWAYNTGAGSIARTSAVLSLDGSQVAFVQNTGGGVASLVFLKWASDARTVTDGHTNGTSNRTTVTSASANFTAADVGASITGTNIPTGTIINSVTNSTTVVISQNATGTSTSAILSIVDSTVTKPKAPSVAPSAANYRSCTAPCMFSITFSGNPNDTNSAPFPDYANDIIYVGANNGTLHKFTGVFTGTPAEEGSLWPVTVHSGTVLSSPVFDSGSGNVFVGDASGRASFVTAAGSLGGTTLQIGAANSIIVDAPIVDSSTGKVFWFAARAQGSSSTLTDWVEQTDTALANPVTLQFANGSSTARTGNMHAGAFDDTYFTTPSSGFLYFCALNPGSQNHPSLWRVGFTNSPTTGTMNSSTNAGPLELGTADTNNECSPITEFKNGSTDRIFVGIQNNANSVLGCGTLSCLVAFDITSAFPITSSAHLLETGGTSGIIIDNSSSTGGASQVYFSPLGNSACGTGGLGGCAVQASQSGLN